MHHLQRWFQHLIYLPAFPWLSQFDQKTNLAKYFHQYGFWSVCYWLCTEKSYSKSELNRSKNSSWTMHISMLCRRLYCSVYCTKFQRIQSVSDDLTEVKVGLEATGHYSYNLLGFLLDKGLLTYVINPLHTNLYRKSLSLRKTKRIR